MVFRAGLRDPCTRDVSETFGKRFMLSKSRETPQVHGARYPPRKKTFGN